MTEQKTRHIVEDQPETEENNPENNTFWDNVLDTLPPWGDEIIALMLIIFGILSFLAIFNVAGDATIPNAWSNTLKNLFGYGSIIVSGAILAMGVVMLLPNIGVMIRLPIRRIIAIEIVFLSCLALMHIITSRMVEMRAVARAGEGGGLVGWALSAPITQLLGSTTVVTFYLLILIVSMGVAIGITPEQLKAATKKIENFFDHLSDRLSEQPAQNRQRRRLQERRREAAARYLLERYEETNRPHLRTPVMRIRPDLANIPPSLRPGAESVEEEEEEALSEHPLFSGAVQGETFNIIGDIISDKEAKKANITPNSGDSKEKMVKRPDGRIKRYFTIEAMNESKKVGRRKKDLPPLELLEDQILNRPDEEEINTKVVLIENTLLEFDIDIDVVDVRVGPTVTQFAVKPYREGKDDEKTQRTRISKIASYQNDLALALSAKRLRIEAPVPGTNFVGIEVPNNEPSLVTLRSVYESKEYYEALQKAKTPLFIPLGRDVAGQPFSIDLAGLPHTLVAGTTGSGKSVALAAMVMALVYNNTPDDVRLIMLDPKMVELSRFNGLPHLMGTVETDQERILGVLRWCTREMDNRYQILEKAGARNISIYNEKVGKKEVEGDPLPYIVIFIDEVGDLMMTNPEDTEHHLTRLAQMARAVGMHLVVATQRPSVDVLTGLIKANFPGRIAFSVASSVDSRVILDASGAETLLGRGDMLFLSSDASGPRRLQGCFITDDEVRQTVKWWEDWATTKRDQGKLDEQRNAPWEKTLTKLELLSETDDLLEEALEAVIRARQASATMLQKHLNIGFPRASRIMDLLFELGAIGPPEPGGKMRRVLISSLRKDPMQEMIERRRKQEQMQKRLERKQAREAEYADEDDDDELYEDEDYDDDEPPFTPTTRVSPAMPAPLKADGEESSFAPEDADSSKPPLSAIASDEEDHDDTDDKPALTFKDAVSSISASAIPPSDEADIDDKPAFKFENPLGSRSAFSAAPSDSDDEEEDDNDEGMDRKSTFKFDSPFGSKSAFSTAPSNDDDEGMDRKPAFKLDSPFGSRSAFSASSSNDDEADEDDEDVDRKPAFKFDSPFGSRSAFSAAPPNDDEDDFDDGELIYEDIEDGYITDDSDVIEAIDEDEDPRDSDEE